MRYFMSKHPQWATRHKRKGTELRLINGKYYLYEVSSKWDPEKKRPQKITGKLLGRITKEEGFIESDKAKLRKKEILVTSLVVKEYGVTAFIGSCLNEYKDLLGKHFPNDWKSILALAYCKLVHRSALKNAEFHYLNSYLSEQYPGLPLSSKKITELLRSIGTQRTQIISFFKEFVVSNDSILFDGTDLISNSKKMDLTKFGKSKKGTYDSIANVMFIFSSGSQLPVYYRILPGNIKDIKAFRLCLEESDISNAVIIADKGFYSKQNIELLQSHQLRFIVPLRRNSELINYDKVKAGGKEEYDGFFKFEKRIIWYYRTKIGDESVNLYLDEELKAAEIKDFIERTETLPEKYNLKDFHAKQYRFGTIALSNNLDESAEQTYITYKSRSQIETMFDSLKNLIDSDRSYMQNEQALEAWMFINYIALHWYYRILQMLKAKNLNSKYAPLDLITFLKEVHKVKINGKWVNAELTKKSIDLLKLLEIPIT
jgi:transposase